ncbi:hypothetical protein [Natronobacterium gregoryi]|uniref:Uncharacterized protein n=2 Tax=Natronobacterium gregoryi TaxID=44930 RepID=L0AHQ9_NATGS|nr:hypothetical protein [Natronobacterium gregoryi]AFZ73341.1 hypothetical protein Natgr_2162 [Natronobacterium gregoryi SP2]PLK18791.1 hypothetical protein CYV19_16995 [Natronobacterium gregoryi SP2]SFJ63955.1 hypothetical protein SAMN05443661_15018 [Natronobacterium gregoryi]
MSSKWYCRDCETRIESDEIQAHEDDGHDVKGVVRPDRLLGNDPWNVGVQHRSADDESTDDEEVSG